MEEKKTTETDTANTSTDSSSTGTDTPNSFASSTPDTPAAPAADTTATTDTAPAADTTSNTPAPETTPTPKKETPETTTGSTDQAAAAGGTGFKQYGTALAIVAVLVAGLVYALEQQGRIDTNFFAFMTPDEQSQPVAIVNGVEITSAEFEQNRSQVIASAQQQGIDLNDPEVQAEIDQQAIEVLVNTQLLRQAAQAAGVTVSEEEVEARYQEIVESVGGEETLMSRMGELGITPESLRADIEGELLVQTLIDSEIDVSGVEVTDEEVQSIYDQAGGTDAGLPPLDEVRTEIEQQIITTQEQELLTEYIESLRAVADIEILI